MVGAGDLTTHWCPRLPDRCDDLLPVVDPIWSELRWPMVNIDKLAEARIETVARSAERAQPVRSDARDQSFLRALPHSLDISSSSSSTTPTRLREASLLVDVTDGCNTTRRSWSQLSTRITRVSGRTPSCCIAAAPSSLSMTAWKASMSETSMLRPTRLGFCGST